MAGKLDVVIGAVVGKLPKNWLDTIETVDYFDLRKGDYEVAFDFLTPVYDISKHDIFTIPKDEIDSDHRFYLCGNCMLSYNGNFLLIFRKKSFLPLQNELWLKVMHNIDVTFEAMDLV